MTPGPTLLGILGDTARGWVDTRGSVTAHPDAPPVGWSVGAEDRWHGAAEESAVRQSLLDHAPVVETRMRIPGGDAVHRCYAIQGPSAEGGHSFVVIEVENESAVPVAVGFVLGEPGLGSLVAPGTVAVGGEAAMVFPAAPHVDPDHGFVVPVPHRTRVRIVVPMRGVAAQAVGFPSVVPDPLTVASGWAAQVRRGARFEPANDADLELFERQRRQLLLVHAADHVFRPGLRPSGDVVSDCEVAVALAELGFAPEAGHLTAGLVERGPLEGAEGNALAWMTGRTWQLTRDRELAHAAVESVAVVARTARKQGAPGARAALEGAATVFDAVGEHDAAAATRRDAARAGSDPRPPGSRVPGPARDVRTLRASLLADDAGGLELVPGFGPAWHGRPVEVHGAPTRWGRLSFALRWHGPRPALLWELESSEGEELPTLSARSVDPDWRGAGATGEALLAAVEPRGD